MSLAATRWAALCAKMGYQLPPEAWNAMKYAYGLPGLLSMNEFLLHANQRGLFTGPNACKHFAQLWSLLSDVWGLLPCVKELQQYLYDFYPEALSKGLESTVPITFNVGTINAGGAVGVFGSLAPMSAPIQPSPPLPASRKRLMNPIEKLEEETYLVVKIPFCDTDLPANQCIRPEVYKVVTGYQRAKRECDLLMDDDIELQDESKIQHIYTVWALRAHAAPEKRQIKSRTVEYKQQASSTSK
jgi:hypothetical protein